MIVTHGLTMRLCLMRYLAWDITDFENVWNPSNCETWVLNKNQKGQYVLDDHTQASDDRDDLSVSQPASQSASS